MDAPKLLLLLPSLFRILASLIFLDSGCGLLKAESEEQRIIANSNQAPAGRIHNGQLIVRLEAAMGEWSPEENDGPALKVAAFREEGGRLLTPGPLLRVLEGTCSSYDRRWGNIRFRVQPRARGRIGA